jgi:hypothetical protein
MDAVPFRFIFITTEINERGSLLGVFLQICNFCRPLGARPKGNLCDNGAAVGINTPNVQIFHRSTNRHGQMSKLRQAGFLGRQTQEFCAKHLLKNWLEVLKTFECFTAFYTISHH